MNLKFSRILFKVSGEALADQNGFGINKNSLEIFCQQISKVQKKGLEIALVVGGGNFWRARDFKNLNIERTQSDQIGMVATSLNGLVLKSYFQTKGIKSKIFSAKNINGSINPYEKEKVLKNLKKGHIIIFTGGTGHPFFTTDSAAVLRGIEIEADVILKGTKVDGIYSSNPEKDKNAFKIDKLTFEEALQKKLKVIDQTAFALLLEKRIPLIVFNIFQKNALEKIISQQKIGSLVY